MGTMHPLELLIWKGRALQGSMASKNSLSGSFQSFFKHSMRHEISSFLYEGFTVLVFWCSGVLVFWWCCQVRYLFLPVMTQLCAPWLGQDQRSIYFIVGLVLVTRTNARLRAQRSTTGLFHCPSWSYIINFENYRESWEMRKKLDWMVLVQLTSNIVSLIAACWAISWSHNS